MTELDAARLPRSSGILLHPTSLPSPFGVGDLGPSAFTFLEGLVETGQRWWQVLPLGPTGYGNSPYQSYSSFAGNPLLISPEGLAEEGLLSARDWADFPALPDDRVEFDAVVAAKDQLLRRAFANFDAAAIPPAFERFTRENAAWLDDYALFMALKDHHGGRAWYDWEPALAEREPKALARCRETLAGSVRYYQFAQFVFDQQWRRLRQACQAKRVSVLGDLPIFVARDSADVWSRPDLFWLDARGRPTVVAGVPPDAFEPVRGQLWGNPLYRWPAHAREGYAWWTARIKAQTDRVDRIRLDHFRGFEAYWEVPAESETAASGRWTKGPGADFLEAVRTSLGGLPLVAEDLGDISPEVYALRDRFHLPGMRVIQFGLEGTPGTEFHLPYSYVNHCVAYTGTHDNDTTHGWFSARPGGSAADRAYHQAVRARARKLVGATGEEVTWDVIRAAFDSVADTVIVPLQDVLALGSSARMNVPGNPKGNWTWRFRPGQVRPRIRAALAELTAVTGRWNGTIPEPYAAPTQPGAESGSVAPAASPSPTKPAAGPRGVSTPERPGKAKRGTTGSSKSAKK